MPLAAPGLGGNEVLCGERAGLFSKRKGSQVGKAQRLSGTEAVLP